MFTFSKHKEHTNTRQRMDTKRPPPCPASSGEAEKNLWRATWLAYLHCFLRRNDCTLADVPAPVCPLPRLNAQASLDLGPENDYDAVTFTERLMDDAAADIHKLDDELAAIKAENALLKAENVLLVTQIDKECDITDALIASLVDECAREGGLTEVGDEYTFYIPLKDNLELAEMIVEKGQGGMTDFFPQGRFSYTRLTFDDGTELEDQYIKLKLEHLD